MTLLFFLDTLANLTGDFFGGSSPLTLVPGWDMTHDDSFIAGVERASCLVVEPSAELGHSSSILDDASTSSSATLGGNENPGTSSLEGVVGQRMSSRDEHPLLPVDNTSYAEQNVSFALIVHPAGSSARRADLPDDSKLGDIPELPIWNPSPSVVSTAHSSPRLSASAKGKNVDWCEKAWSANLQRDDHADEMAAIGRRESDDESLHNLWSDDNP
ncbi:hypothetical protein BV22DRAFT_1134791 [Leucogyrophana mollusca]|uniref:Uncharacterized protein n=1 Tax=Leucogyrophana mollusca TaxID=85980 RepID=A0ACB8AZ90_9AGAM|nr:hypothetical protein BV22DRAFT_1134791 [Leucogyrophana mollusca]